MKKLIIILVVAITSTILNAQNNLIKDSILINGNCKMCKQKIETAAYIKGVKKATWNIENKYLTIIYKPEKTVLSNIENSIAKSGYDTPNVKAVQTTYQQLPACCKYRE